jgi:hypothetical protein
MTQLYSQQGAETLFVLTSTSRWKKASCSFNTSLCVRQNYDASLPAVVADSSVVDLNEGFGLNLPKTERVGYRRRTCTVLPLDGYTTLLNALLHLPLELPTK